MRPRRRSIAVLLTLASVAIGPRASFAQGAAAAADDPEGRAATERGVRALEERRFNDAVEALREAEQRRPTPITRLNLALALRGLGRYVEAIEVLERYLAAPEPGAPPERLAGLRQGVAEMRAALVRLRVRVEPSSAALTIDGRPHALGDAPLVLDPMPHALELRADGFRAHRQSIAGRAGSEVVVDVRLEPNDTRGRLRVDAAPGDARVAIDGRLVGRGRVAEALPAGDHVVDVEAPGHVPVRRSVHLAPGAALRLDVALVPRAGPPWAAILGVAAGVVVLGGVALFVADATRGVERPVDTSWGHLPER